jgi:hypothetical protein
MTLTWGGLHLPRNFSIAQTMYDDL